MYLSSAEESVGKPLVEVLAEEKEKDPRHIADVVKEIAAQVPEEEWDKVPTVEAFEKFRAQDDGIEDVETQVERELKPYEEEAFLTHSAPQWGSSARHLEEIVTKSRTDGHDGDIKTDSDPDRELGHHLRGALRILSEAFFGKKKTPDTNAYIKGLEESIKSQDVWRAEIEQWKTKAQHYADELLATAIRENNANKDIERLNERVKKEMAFQTETSVQGDAAVDQLRKELEFKTSMLAESETAVKKLTDDRYSLSQEVENWKDQYTDLLEKSGKLQDNYNLLKSVEVTPETADIFTLKEEVKRYKGICETLSDQIEKLETYAEKREEQIAGWLEKIESLEADAKDAKTKNAVLPEPAVKFLQSEVIRLKGELDAAKEAIDHFRKQPIKSKPGRKVSGDEATIMDAIEFAMNKTAAAWSADSGYSHPERLVEKMYSEWMEEAQK